MQCFESSDVGRHEQEEVHRAFPLLQLTSVTHPVPSLYFITNKPHWHILYWAEPLPLPSWHFPPSNTPFSGRAACPARGWSLPAARPAQGGYGTPAAGRTQKGEHSAHALKRVSTHTLKRVSTQKGEHTRTQKGERNARTHKYTRRAM